MIDRQNLEQEAPPVLKVEDLAVAYKVRGGEIEAVQNVSFDIRRGESHGIVGESGCGKSTVAWAIVNFLGDNGYVKRGTIKFQGQELVGKTGEELRRLRGDQMVRFWKYDRSRQRPVTVQQIPAEAAYRLRLVLGQTAVRANGQAEKNHNDDDRRHRSRCGMGLQNPEPGAALEYERDPDGVVDAKKPRDHGKHAFDETCQRPAA